MKTLVSFLLISALVVAVASPARAEEEPKGEESEDFLSSHDLGAFPYDTDATWQALTALFAAANDVIPASSGCGRFSEKPEDTVKDMLAAQLAYLYRGGDYEIRGNCHQHGRCAVAIDRNAGESVSIFVISFEIAEGKANMPTLKCWMMP